MGKIYFDMKLFGTKEELKEVSSFIKKNAKKNSSYMVASKFIGLLLEEKDRFSLEIGMQNYGLSEIEGFDNEFFFLDFSKNFPKLNFVGNYKTENTYIKYKQSKGELLVENIK